VSNVLNLPLTTTSRLV